MEEVVRADFSAKPGDPTAFRLFQAVSKARETAKEANKEVAKAYEIVAWTSAELITHLAKGKDHTDGSVGSRRHIEGARQTKYPWRGTEWTYCDTDRRGGARSLRMGTLAVLRCSHTTPIHPYYCVRGLLNSVLIT